MDKRYIYKGSRAKIIKNQFSPGIIGDTLETTFRKDYTKFSG
jgi:hypothetical protein